MVFRVNSSNSQGYTEKSCFEKQKQLIYMGCLNLCGDGSFDVELNCIHTLGKGVVRVL